MWELADLCEHYEEESGKLGDDEEQLASQDTCQECLHLLANVAQFLVEDSTLAKDTQLHSRALGAFASRVPDPNGDDDEHADEELAAAAAAASSASSARVSASDRADRSKRVLVTACKRVFRLLRDACPHANTSTDAVDILRVEESVLKLVKDVKNLPVRHLACRRSRTGCARKLPADALLFCLLFPLAAGVEVDRARHQRERTGDAANQLGP